MSKKRKTRVEFRKNHQSRQRDQNIVRRLEHGDEGIDEPGVESIRAKGKLSRKRTVILDEAGEIAIDDPTAMRGRVVTARGLHCVVATESGQTVQCYTRRLLKSFAQDARNAVATGDWVHFRPAPAGEGLILKVEPRKSVLTRSYQKREQIIAANVDQALIVCALAEPELRRNLIDRYLVSAGLGGLQPLVCLNKADLVGPSDFQPLLGTYAQIGIPVVLTSTTSGLGMEELRRRLAGRETVIVGQSGVGKSSLLNALEPDWRLKIGDVSVVNQKGKHTTTVAQWLALPGGGSVIDTPGIRQFELWKVESGDVERFFPEFGPFSAHCRFHGCLHLDDQDCAVRSAVADRLISYGRYVSYERICRPTERPSVEDEW